MEATLLSSEVANKIQDCALVFRSSSIKLHHLNTDHFYVWILWGVSIWVWIRILLHIGGIIVAIKKQQDIFKIFVNFCNLTNI
jgi:hypothetical protein